MPKSKEEVMALLREWEAPFNAYCAIYYELQFDRSTGHVLRAYKYQAHWARPKMRVVRTALPELKKRDVSSALETGEFEGLVAELKVAQQESPKYVVSNGQRALAVYHSKDPRAPYAHTGSLGTDPVEPSLTPLCLEATVHTASRWVSKYFREADTVDLRSIDEETVLAWARKSPSGANQGAINDVCIEIEIRSIDGRAVPTRLAMHRVEARMLAKALDQKARLADLGADWLVRCDSLRPPKEGWAVALPSVLVRRSPPNATPLDTLIVVEQGVIDQPAETDFDVGMLPRELRGRGVEALVLDTGTQQAFIYSDGKAPTKLKTAPVTHQPNADEQRQEPSTGMPWLLVAVLAVLGAGLLVWARRTRR
jgi:hypothetical protein